MTGEAELDGLERGTGGTPIVLLHGFGGSRAVWDAVVDKIAGARRTLALDLPGHGGSLAHPSTGGGGAAAQAVLADLERRGIGRAHLVGHSWGGTVALVAALREPTRIGSLTLLAPGGFGGEINHRLLRRYAAACGEAELTIIMEQFFGWERPLPEGFVARLAQERRVEGAAAALQVIVESFFENGTQKVVPREALEGLTMPTKVLWGTQDRVLPTRQAHRLPGHIAVHIFENVGHMLPLEIPGDVARLILENVRP